tara:strand:+ start:1088 stop:1366 length:279 start_codon:yes stop_codon:yes gene_type:complete
MLAISPKPVIIILMKIEKEFEENDNELNAEEAMEASMAFINDILIQPALERDELNKEDAKILGVVADALKVIAQKAKAYEMLRENGNEYFRN